MKWSIVRIKPLPVLKVCISFSVFAKLYIFTNILHLSSRRMSQVVGFLCRISHVITSIEISFSPNHKITLPSVPSLFCHTPTTSNLCRWDRTLKLNTLHFAHQPCGTLQHVADIKVQGRELQCPASWDAVISSVRTYIPTWVHLKWKMLHESWLSSLINNDIMKWLIVQRRTVHIARYPIIVKHGRVLTLLNVTNTTTVLTTLSKNM